MRPLGSERWLRPFMALLVTGCVAMAAWTGGCGRDTIVQPDGSASDDLVDRPKDIGNDKPEDIGNDKPEDVGNDKADDLGNADLTPNEDAQPMACCTGSEADRCLSGTQAIKCNWRYNVPAICQTNPASSTYGYAWYVSDCAKGCDPATSSCRP